MMPAEPEFEVLVRKVRSETSEIRSFELTAKPGEVLPPFEAGAHIDVFPLPGLSRQYSLVNDPQDRGRYVIGVKRELNGRGGSSAMHTQLREGTVVRIGTPRNNFALRPDQGRCLLLAGGIGVTPLLSMAQALWTRGVDYELHYFARSNSEIAFRDLILESPWSSRVAYHYDLVPPLLNDVLDEILRARPGDASLYVCGPNPFMDIVKTCAEAGGWPAGSIVMEHFSAEPPKLVAGAGEFVVRLAKSGLELIVPSDKAIIDVLREADVEIKTSCEQGVCGTCLTAVIEGEPDHHDLYLSDEEHAAGRLMTPCVSRCKSKLLVLDI